ncbi:MAG: hypothetical protein ACEQSB_03665 [Undibacterium sp.]
MQYRFASLFALALFFPSVARACMPQNPYFYLVKGAYLFALLGLVLALVFELFRYAVETRAARWWLRRCGLGFAVFAVIMLILGCAYQVLDRQWQAEFGTPSAGASGQRC